MVIKCYWENDVIPMQLALVPTCLVGQLGINCPSAFLKILELPEWNKGNSKIFKNHEGDLPQNHLKQTCNY